jgi:hypothetical protein
MLDYVAALTSLLSCLGFVCLHVLTGPHAVTLRMPWQVRWGFAATAAALLYRAVDFVVLASRAPQWSLLGHADALSLLAGATLSYSVIGFSACLYRRSMARRLHMAGRAQSL